MNDQGTHKHTLPRYGIETVVSAPDTILQYDEKRNLIKSIVSDHEIRLFLKVKVKISIEDTGVGGLRSKLTMGLVEPVIPGFSVDGPDNEESMGLKRKANSIEQAK